MKSVESVAIHLCAPLMLLSMLVLGMPLRAATEDEKAQAVAQGYLKLLDKDNAEDAWGQVGQYWRRVTSKREFMEGVQTWLKARAGTASGRELVMRRTLSADEANTTNPESKVKGPVYIFRFRSEYPKGKFFEDVTVIADDNGTLRIAAHLPQPVE